MHIQLNELPGRLVLDATGDVIGRIKSPLVETETWLVDVLRVKLSRKVAEELGLAWSWWKPATMELQTGLIHAAGDAIILRVSLAELRDAMPTVPSDVAAESVH